MEVDDLPATVPPNKHSGPVTLVIHLSVLILPLGGGATGHDGGIIVDAHFDLVGHKRFDSSAPQQARVYDSHGARLTLDTFIPLSGLE